MTHSSSQFVCGGAITNTLVGSSGGFGIRNWPSFTYDIVPLTKSATAYAASQSPGSAAIVLTAGTGVTKGVSSSGQVIYTADVPRTIVITSGGVDTGINFLVRGFDYYGATMSEAITGASAAAATGKKAFYSVLSITPSGAVASTVTVGTSDVLGMPVQTIDKGYVGTLAWNNTIGFDTGTFVVADQTTPATTTTGDVRGTYLPSSATNGTKRLVVELLCNANQINNQPAVANTVSIIGVTQV